MGAKMRRKRRIKIGDSRRRKGTAGSNSRCALRRSGLRFDGGLLTSYQWRWNKSLISSGGTRA
ncbi:hypothetical protein DY000_02015781 [Brassica cretica]|uniref:Uncharacterized protein n=1 Tax=Brassica cretica TaxID=69181 RepID=A0ABQ7D401_BRACR|nr:hypothetical protein DY000_02015781 [Brassica cretica]